MTDGQLLECFVTRGDGAAFEALVRRHGPMVLGVCRRVLRNPQDAEDAFQATFLVLIRKAASIGRRELLGNWLYGVAYRTALDARAAAARRRARERQVSPMPEPQAGDGADVWRDLRPLLDQELIWGVEKGEVIVSLKGSKPGPRTVAFSPDGKVVAAGGPDGKVRLWDVQTGELKETLEGHKAEIYAIAFAPDGKTLASVSQDQTVRLWPIDKRAGGRR
jgi:RNA polymerase sigma factor (sigma-70 family)